LFIVGGSVNKATMAQQIINYWKPEYPELIVVASKELGAEFPPVPGNVSYKLGHLSNSEKLELQDSSMYHVTASSAEGYGYTMAEALSFGAIPIWTDLPVYKENWSGLLGDYGLIKTTATAAASDKLDCAVKITEEGLTACMNKLLAGSPKFKINFQDQCKIYIKELNSKFKAKFRETWLSTIASAEAEAVTRFAPPKMLPAADLPIVGVVTLFYNRPEWFSHAVRNLLTCDYPRDKLVWVIVDDSDAALRVDLKVEQARKQYPDLNIQYVSCSRRLSVGEKRNRGISAATTAASASVIAFMDDDDHYPKASLILRVLWLLNSKRGLVYCSTLPMYDITKYISAINVPPLNLSPSRRVSEASMCFTAEFWSKRKFPDISVAEGEGFIEGRELDTVEIPPEGVIVSFLHGKNSTSRRVPEQKEANGCHYGFSDEYFTMISQIAPPAPAAP
jgi:hypothetical protein